MVQKKIIHSSYFISYFTIHFSDFAALQQFHFLFIPVDCHNNFISSS